MGRSSLQVETMMGGPKHAAGHAWQNLGATSDADISLRRSVERREGPLVYPKALSSRIVDIHGTSRVGQHD